MFEQNSYIIIVIVLLFFIVWNYQTPKVEGFKKFNIKKFVKSATKSAGAVIATGAGVAGISSAVDTPAPTPASAPASAPTPAPAPAPDPVQDAVIVAATTSPSQNEIQSYLDKIKSYSSDAVKMSDSVKDIATNFSKAYDEAANNLTKLTETAAIKAENAVAKITDIQSQISKKANEIQVQVNSNNIVKNEIQNVKNEIKDIQKNVSGNVIEVKDLKMQVNELTTQAKESAEKAASIIPTVYKNVVGSSITPKLVEGFSGFNTELEGYTVFSKPNTGSKNSFDIEDSLVNKLNLFNTAYYAYISDKSAANLAAVNTANKNLQVEINNMSAYISGQSNTSETEANFVSKHNEIKTKASEIESLRADLDMKMLEILKAKDGIPTDYSIDRDTTAYTSILWTALATSLLYFVFIEME
jgi:hypothetical protein